MYVYQTLTLFHGDRLMYRGPKFSFSTRIVPNGSRPSADKLLIIQFQLGCFGLELIFKRLRLSNDIKRNGCWDPHDDVIKWKHFQRYWSFVRGIHRSRVDSPHKGQWRGTLMLSLICAWINDWVNKRGAGDLRRHRAHYDVIVMSCDVNPNDVRHRDFAA